jgi:Glycosyl hydrolases family 16
MGWTLPATDFYRIRDLAGEGIEAYAGRTLETHLGGALAVPASTADYEAGYTPDASGYDLVFLDHFDVRANGTSFDVGETPYNITNEAGAKSGPKHWWSPGRGPIGDGTIIAPGASFANLYQIREASILGIGAHYDGTTRGQGTIQTQRRGATSLFPTEWGVYDYDANVSFDIGYGYWECRFKPEAYPGSWPGFWMESSDQYDAWMYPRIELDCVEEYLTTESERNAHHGSAFVHRNNPAVTAPGFSPKDSVFPMYTSLFEADGTTPLNMHEDYHTYGLLLSPDYMIYYFDRKELFRRPMINEWRRRYHMTVSHQVQGGDSGFNFGVGMEIGTTYWLLVDYVACWEHPTIAATMPARPSLYVPPTFNPSAKAIDIEAIEGGILQKWGRQAILPDGHPGKTVAHSDANPAPIMPALIEAIRSVAVPDGTSFGSATATNAGSITREIVYSLGGADSEPFQANSATGEVTLRAGAELEAKVYDFSLIASTLPPTPTVLGRHATRVRLDIRPDETFDVRYFDNGEKRYLRMWAEASSETVVLDGSNKVESLQDKSSYRLGFVGKMTQVNPSFRPGYSATGVNGFPAIDGGGSTIRIPFKPYALPAGVLESINVRPAHYLSITCAGTERRVGNGTLALDTPTVAVVEINMDGANLPANTVRFNINGSDVALSNGQGTQQGNAVIAVVFQYRAAPSIAGMIWDLDGLLADAAGFYWLDGYVAYVSIIHGADFQGLTATEKNKLIASLHWKYGVQANLAADHPYKSAPPKMHD